MKSLLTTLLYFFSFYLFAQPTTIVEEIINPSALYKDADTIYFSSWATGDINYKVLTENDSTFSNITGGFNFPFGLHKRNNFLYVGHQLGITRIDLSKDPIEIENIISDHTFNVSGIEIVNNMIYYSRWRSVGQVWSLNLDDNSTELISFGFDSPSGIIYWENFLFVADVGDDIIYKIDLSEDNIENEIFLEVPNPNHLFLEGNTLYFGQFRDGIVRKIDLTDPNKEVTFLYDNSTKLTGIAVDGNDLYFGDFDNSEIKLLSSEIIGPVVPEEKEQINVFPNPTSEFIRSENFNIDSKYIIIDVKGIIIQEGELREEKIEVDLLPSGAYFLFLPKENKCARFIKI